MKRRTTPPDKQNTSVRAKAQRIGKQDDQSALTAPSAYASPLPECLAKWTGNLLYWVANMGAQFYADVVAPFGINPSQVAILQILVYEGSMRQARISDRTRIDKATMVSLLNDLEEQKLIERRPAPNDGRAFDVYVLDAGKERLRMIEQASVTANQQFFAVLSLDEQRALHAMLERLATSNNSVSPSLRS